MSTTLLQFYNQNMHRNFPLDEFDGYSQVPPSLLVNAQFYIPDTCESDTELYLSRLQRNATKLTLFFSVKTGQILYADVLRTAQLPLAQSAVYSEFPVSFNVTKTGSTPVPTAQIKNIYGRVVVGSTSGLAADGVLAVQVSQGKIHPACIHRLPMGVQALVVDGKRLTGEITLEAGEHVTLDVDESNNKIIVSASEPSSWDQLIAANVKAIKTINGKGPSEQGNFVIKGMDCSQVKNTPYGLQISNPCSKPCCSATNADVDNAISYLQQTEKRLSDYYVSVSAAIDAMLSRLAVLVTAVSNTPEQS